MRWRRGRLPRPRFPSLHKSLEAYGGTIASASDSEEVLGDRALGEFFEPYLYTSLFPASSHIGLRFLHSHVVVVNVQVFNHLAMLRVLEKVRHS